MQDIQRENRARIEVVHGDIEKALDLCRVQIHGQHALNATFGDQVRHKFRRDWRARLGAAVLAGISKIGDHRRYTCSR